MKKLPWRNNYFIVILSLLGTMGVHYCINVQMTSLAYTNSMAAFLLWVCWLFPLRRLTVGEQWNSIHSILNPCFGFSLCFIGSMAAGVQLDNVGNVDFTNTYSYLAVLVSSVAAAPILACTVRKLEKHGDRGREADIISSDLSLNRKKYFLMVWGILFLAYVPVLLASFPGFFSYDSEVETYMVFTGKYTTQQPMLHVFLLGWTIRIIYWLTKSYNAAISSYIVLQMAALSACFAYMMSFLRSVGVKRWICNLGIVFLALFPTVSMFVCCSTKDGIFSGGVVLLTTLLLELARDMERFWQSKSKKILLGVALLFVLFFRNNGIYALVVFLLFFAIKYRKTWRCWLPVIVGTFLVFVITTFSLMAAFHFKKGPMGEMLCVPMQQLARVHAEAKGSFTEDDLDILYNLIPEVILENYNPKLADSVKVNFLEDNFKASPAKYIYLWYRTGLEHIDIYINAFLENTYGYWYPDTVLDGYRGIHILDRVYQDSSYFEFVTENPGTRMHFLPRLENIYEKISLKIYQQKLPVISMLFSTGFWHWIYAFLAFYLILTRHGKQAFALAVIGLLYLTVLLGPIAIVRYVLYLFFAVPLVLALLFDTKAVSGDNAVP